MIDTIPTLTLRLTKWVPLTLDPPLSQPQMAFLLLDHLEAFYGGAAGGGKSFSLLAAALQWADVPGYSALILRRTYAELSMPGGLMDMAARWLTNTAARWDEEKKTWHFPTGGIDSTLTFGYLEGKNDKYRYSGQAYQFVGFDEIQNHPFGDYTELLTRMRKEIIMPAALPLRARATGNPPTEDQYDWPRQYFVQDGPRATPRRPFIPARLEDNHAIDQIGYDAALRRADPMRYEQLRWGNWLVQVTGDLFPLDRLIRLPAMPTAGVLGRVRYWDKAGTEGGGAYTAGGRLSRLAPGVAPVEYVVEDMIRGQWHPTTRNRVIRQVAGIVRDGETRAHPPDPPGTVVWVEQEPASSGKESALITISELAGVEVYAERVTGDKLTRARPFAAQMGAGNVGYVVGPWNRDWLAELRPAPKGLYWDQIDTNSGAFGKLALLQPDAWAPLATVPARDWSRMRTT